MSAQRVGDHNYAMYALFGRHHYIFHIFLLPLPRYYYT